MKNINYFGIKRDLQVATIVIHFMDGNNSSQWSLCFDDCSNFYMLEYAIEISLL